MNDGAMFTGVGGMRVENLHCIILILNLIKLNLIFHLYMYTGKNEWFYLYHTVIY